MFFPEKITSTRHSFFILFSSLFLFFFFFEREILLGRTSPANILMKKHHPITQQLFDHMTFQRLFIYSQSTLLQYHHIKVLQREKRELEGIPEVILHKESTGADLGGGCRGCALPLPEMTSGFLIQLVFCKKKLCGLLVLKRSKRRVHPLLKKSWIRP